MAPVKIREPCSITDLSIEAFGRALDTYDQTLQHQFPNVPGWQQKIINAYIRNYRRMHTKEGPLASVPYHLFMRAVNLFPPCHVTVLDFTSVDLSKNSLRLGTYPNLRYLDLGSTAKTGYLSAVLMNELHLVPLLVELNLGSLHVSADLLHLIGDRLRNLHTLQIKNSSITNGDLHVFASIIGLNNRYRDIQLKTSGFTKSLYLVQTCPQLTKLDFSAAKVKIPHTNFSTLRRSVLASDRHWVLEVYDSPANNPFNIQQYMGVTEIRVEWKDLATVAEHCPNLQKLVLHSDFIPLLDNNCLRALPHLTYFELEKGLDENHMFQHEALPIIQVIGHQLKTLILVYCENSDLARIAEICPQLECLSFRGCTYLQASQVRPEKNPAFPNLREFEVAEGLCPGNGYCTTAQACKYVVYNSPGLREVHFMHDCSEFVTNLFIHDEYHLVVRALTKVEMRLCGPALKAALCELLTDPASSLKTLAIYMGNTDMDACCAQITELSDFVHSRNLDVEVVMGDQPNYTFLGHW